MSSTPHYRLPTVALVLNLLLLFPLIDCLPSKWGIDCVEEATVPNTRDCLDLITFLHDVSRRPGEGLTKKWGRAEKDTPVGRTAHLPKRYYMAESKYAPPRSCMFYLDEKPRGESPLYDFFNIGDIADIGERTVARCLLNEGQGGMGYPGRYGTVYSQLTRYKPLPAADDLSSDNDGPTQVLSGTAGNATALITQTVGNATLTLFEETPVLEPELGAKLPATSGDAQPEFS